MNCPAGWDVTARWPSCNYTGGHYCDRAAGHRPPHRCVCGATTTARSALPEEDPDPDPGVVAEHPPPPTQGACE